MTRHAPTPPKGGWSIVETLMLASLLAIILSIAIVLIDPVAHLAISRNAKRWSDVNTIGNILANARAESALPPEFFATGTTREICRTSVSRAICETKGLLYVKTPLPTDPSTQRGEGSGYAVEAHDDGTQTVTALFAEDGDMIHVRR